MVVVPKPTKYLLELQMTNRRHVVQFVKKFFHHTPAQLRSEGCKFTVPSSEAEQLRLLASKPNTPLNSKRLRVAVVGKPNAGKSTLINSLTGTSLLPTSRKIDTTVNNTLSVLTSDDTQIEFFDSPGIRSKANCSRYKLKYEHSKLPDLCMEEAHMSMVVVDLLTSVGSTGKLHAETLLHLMKHKHVPSILVLNKVDRIYKRMDLLPIMETMTNGMVDGVCCGPENTVTVDSLPLPPLETEVIKTFENVENLTDVSKVQTAIQNERRVLKELKQCSGWPYFKQVFIVSALKGEQLSKLRKYLLSKAVPEQWHFHSRVQTDQSPYEIATGVMRSALLENLADEMPYITSVAIEEWRQENGIVNILFVLGCTKLKQVQVVERMGKTIVFGVKRRLQKIFDADFVINMIAERK